MPDFPEDFYDENGIYIPRLYGKPWHEWATQYGLYNKEDILAFVEEQRMDVIGSNGNDGDHYGKV